MPLYDYKCDKCNNIFEVTQKLSDEPLTKCQDPNCDGTVHKQFPLSSFQFKGTGWGTDLESKRKK